MVYREYKTWQAVLVCFATLFCPPFGAYVAGEGCGPDALITVCLCILGFIPGIIYAYYLLYDRYITNARQLPTTYKYNIKPTVIPVRTSLSSAV